jgi:O-methyltransferase
MSLKEEYISLIKGVLLGLNRINRKQYKPLKQLTDNIYECELIEQDLDKRMDGRDWPLDAESMIGIKRMDNVKYCVEEVIKNGIPGDFIETGVWRGGTCIFMRALLKAHNVTDRTVWVADSFEGLPKPDPDSYPEDSGDKLHTYNELKISEEEVKNYFRNYNLLDNQVKFLKGWFKDTMPTSPIEKLSILRLDGDMYESTIDVLIHLYPKLSVGGYCIIDDWGAIPACKKAVEDYRLVYGLDEQIAKIDWTGVFWKKRKEVEGISPYVFFKKLTKERGEHWKKRVEDYNQNPLIATYSVFEDGMQRVKLRNLVKNPSEDCGFISLSNDPQIILTDLALANDSEVLIYVDIDVEEVTKLQVFFKTRHKPNFKEDNSVKELLRLGRNQVIIEISEDDLMGEIRIDPGDYKGNYRINRVEIRQSK